MSLYLLGYGSLDQSGGGNINPNKLVSTHDTVLAQEYMDERKPMKSVEIKPKVGYAGLYCISPDIEDIFEQHENSNAICKIGYGSSLFRRIDSYKIAFVNGVYEVALVLVSDKKQHPSLRKFLSEIERFVHRELKKYRVKPLWNTYTVGKYPEWFETRIYVIRRAFKALKHKYGDSIRVLFPFQE